MATILSFSYILGDNTSHLIPESLNPEITTLDQASNTIPAGAYTTFRTFQKTKALLLDEHFQRLKSSATLAGHPVELDIPVLRKHIQEAIRQFPESEARIRLTIPFTEPLSKLYIFLSALSVPTQAQKANGVSVLTDEFQRTTPAAKLSNFIQSSQTARERLKEGYEEILMTDDRQNILEGLTSNFFAVVDGVIWTAGTGVLAGITRQFVLKLAEEADYEVIEESASLIDLPRFTEAFITSTSRGVLPVTEINHQRVGIGMPGPVTRRLMALYDLRVAAEVEPI